MRNLVVHLLDRVRQLESLAARLRHQSADVCLGQNKVRLGNVNGRLFYGNLQAVRFGIELDEHVSFAHTTIVVHEHSHPLASHPRGNEGDVAVNLGIVQLEHATKLVSV